MVVEADKEQIKMEIRTTILGTSRDVFEANLIVEIDKSINAILECEEPKIMAIQFRDAEAYNVANLVDVYRRTDGQYVFEGQFHTRQELEEKFAPFCKEISISVVPKELDFGTPREQVDKQFGFIKYHEYNIAGIVGEEYDNKDLG